MTTLPTTTLTQSATLVGGHIDALSSAMEAEILEMVERFDDLPELFQALGLTFDPSISEEEAESIMAIRMGVNAIPKIMETVLGIGLDEAVLEQAHATVQHHLRAHKTPERMLTDLYDLASVPTAKVAAQPGMVEHLKPVTDAYTFYGFQDGSGFLKVDTGPENRAFFEAWSAALTRADEIKPDTRTKMGQGFQGAVDAMAADSNLSPAGRQQVQAMVDGMVVNLLRSLCLRDSLLVPLSNWRTDSVDLLLGQLADKESPDAWRKGVVVEFDGQPLATPNALRVVLGQSPQASLQESLARLALASTAGTAG